MRSEIPRPAATNPTIDTADVKLPSASTIGAQTTLASTSQENAVKQVEITAFQDVETPAIAILPMAQSTTSIAHFDNTFDLKEFLRRPFKLWHSQLSATTNSAVSEFAESDPQKPIISWSLPGDVLAGGNKLQKVMNHQFFKADIKIKLVLNTSPFVAGRFYLTYSPYENTISEARQQKWASRAGLTAYPGVEVDAQLDNSVELTIPFASFKESYVLTVKEEDFVTLSLYALTEILGPTGATIDMAVYAWFENVELNIPTLKPLAQMPTDAITTKVVKEPLTQDQMTRLNIGRQVQHLRRTNKIAYDYIMANLGRVDTIHGTMQVQAENLTQKGPVESIAGTVKDVADIVGGLPIPVVNEIAPIVGWVADIAGSIAGIFGWSKPNSYAQVQPLQNVPGKFYTHFDSEDQSVSLSLTAKNELDKLNNIFPSAADEMDLGYVCANPALKYRIPWTSNAKAGETFLYDSTFVIPVGIGSFNAKSLAKASGYSNYSTLGPAAMYGCPGDDTPSNGYISYKAFNRYPQSVPGNPIYPTKMRVKGTVNKYLLSTAPCEYVSQMFKYWRATLCFKISVVKTAFHTGRLEIFFDPGMYNSKVNSMFIEPDTAYYKNVDSTNNYKYILDLTNDTEVTIKIPFVSERLFLSTRGLNTGTKMPTMNDVAESIIGSLIIRPVSHLMHPETVKNQVDILVWKWAEDVVFSCPINSGGTDLSIYVKEEEISFPSVTVIDIDRNILRKLPISIDGKQYPLSCGAATDKEDNGCDDGFITNNGDCIRVSGIAQINIGNKAEANVITFFSTTNVEQENMNACKNAAGERLVNLRPLLRIFRHYIEVDGQGQPINLTINAQAEDNRQAPDYLSYLSYMYRFFRGGFRYKIMSDGKTVTSRLLEKQGDSGKLTPSHITFPALNPVHEISVPYYSQYRKLPISSSEAGIMQLNVKTDATSAKLLRAGNDDLTFGWLMGTPQLFPGNTEVTWSEIEAVETGKDSEDSASPETFKKLTPNLGSSPIKPPPATESSDEFKGIPVMTN